MTTVATRDPYAFFPGMPLQETVGGLIAYSIAGPERSLLWKVNYAWRQMMEHVDAQCYKKAELMIKPQLQHISIMLAGSFVQNVDPEALRAELDTQAQSLLVSEAQRVSQLFSWNQLYSLLHSHEAIAFCDGLEVSRGLLPELYKSGAQTLFTMLGQPREQVQIQESADAVETWVARDLEQCARDLIAGTIHRFEVVAEEMVGAPLIGDLLELLENPEFHKELSARLSLEFRDRLVQGYREKLGENGVKKWVDFRRSEMGSEFVNCLSSWLRSLQLPAVAWIARQDLVRVG